MAVLSFSAPSDSAQSSQAKRSVCSSSHTIEMGDRVPAADGIPSKEMVETMARALLGALSSAASSTPTPAATHGPTTPVPSPPVTTVGQALKRQFPSMFQTKHELKRGKGRFCSPVRSSPAKTTNLTIFALPGPTTHTPKSSKELELAHAGLGRRLVTVTEDCKHADIVTQIEKEFKKFRPLEGRWMFFKAAGGSGQRKLSAVPMDTEGYSGQQLRAVTSNGKSHLFLVPLQEELDMEPLPYDSAEFAKMPQVPCLTCNATMPLQMLALHAANCQPTVNVQDDEVVIEDDDTEEQGLCPICQTEFPMSVLANHGSECAERAYREPVKEEVNGPGPSHHLQPDIEVAGTSSGYAVDRSPPASVETASQMAWNAADTPQEAIQLFFEDLRRGGVNQPPLMLTLNAREDDEHRDFALISFYKHDRPKSQWAAPFHCRIIGDAAVGVGVTRHILSSAISKLKHGFKLNLGNAAVTTLLEGQTDHLVPVLSTSLLESDLLMMAGRMIGHSLIHGGPALSGLSPAVVDALIYSTKGMAASKLCLEDCSDVEHREIIGLVMKEQWTEEETSQIKELCLNWYCPVPTNETNRLLLFQQLLSHAVLGRAHAQIKQIRKGLKDTGVWPLLATRPDVVPLFFPREAEVQLTPEVILQRIRWPQAKEANSDDSDDEVPIGTVSAITGYLRTFIENATSGILSKLCKFWTGWEVPPCMLHIEIVKSRGKNHLPTASTCYERLRIPDHYCSYSGLRSDLMICIESVDSGFGLV